MTGPAAELSAKLAHQAEEVCRHYLSNGRKAGRYWLVGDAANTPGRSLYVRLYDGHGPAGKWNENVAPRFMLRRCVLAQPRGKLGGSTQHNVSALREVRDAP